MKNVYAVFNELDNRYSTDSDDVALLYINKAKRNPNIMKSLKMHAQLKNLLILIFDGGWTSSNEYEAMALLAR